MPAFLDEVEAAVPSLRRYARALTHDVDRADDLVQDCLERALAKQALFRPTGPVRAWLFRILLNLFRNEARRARRAPATVTLDGSGADLASAAPQASRLALAETARAIERLPGEQREALLLVVVEGLSYGEAAEALGIPTGTLMSRLGRARESLRTMTDTTTTRLRTAK